VIPVRVGELPGCRRLPGSPAPRLAGQAAAPRYIPFTELANLENVTLCVLRTTLSYVTSVTHSKMAGNYENS